MSGNTKTKASLGPSAGATVGATTGIGTAGIGTAGKRIGAARPGGLAGWLAGWLLGRLRGTAKPAPRLQLVERITLGPRQTLALVEAEGRRVLVATSPEGAPAFYAIDGSMIDGTMGVKLGRVAVPARPPRSMRASW